MHVKAGLLPPIPAGAQVPSLGTSHERWCEPRDNYLHIVTGIEGLKIKLPVWLGSPEAQVDGVVCVKARDWVVIGNCCDLHMQSQPFETAALDQLVQKSTMT